MVPTFLQLSPNATNGLILKMFTLVTNALEITILPFRLMPVCVSHLRLMEIPSTQNMLFIENHQQLQQQQKDYSSELCEPTYFKS